MPAAAAEEELPLRRPASCSELFWACTRLALQGFGGVLAIAQHELVERQRWLTKAEFVELLSVGQVLPGPNIVNMGLMLGDRFFGWRGALAAVGGLLLLPMLLVLALAGVYARFASLPWVAGALHGMGAVAAGLVLAIGLRLLPSLAHNPMGRPLCGFYGLATLAAIAGLRWPLAWVVLGLGVPACATAAWRLRRQSR